MTTRHRITTAAVVALGLATAAGPAWAYPADQTANGSEVPAGSPSVSNQASVPSTVPTVVRVAPSGGGFDWADAGIGAGGAFALSMIALGGAAVVSQRRSRQTQNTAQTS